MAIDLHLVSWNRPKMTRLVIETIHRNTKRGNYRLVVLDNGSDKSTKTMIQTLHDNGLVDEFISWPENLGLEAARQEMLDKSTHADYFICVDNDCLPQPIQSSGDWLEKLVELMQKYEDYAAISCRTQVMIGTGNIFEFADKTGKDLVEFAHPGGSYRIMSTEAVRRVGGWARKQPGRGQEEKYICNKLHEAGYRTGFAARIPTLHLFGTRGDNGTDQWGYNKDMKPEESGHSDIWHPALAAGDDLAEIIKYSGEDFAHAYCSSS